MNWLVSAIVTGFLNWLTPIIARFVKNKKDEKEASQVSSEVKTKIETAKTEKEIEDAAKHAANNSF